MKLSIIIPVYNAENYIEKCIESLYNQNILIQDFEVILINDGSTDNSLSIVEKYKKKYENIEIINSKNSGPANARNLGLEIAKGKYITFLDSDDEIFPNTLHFILEKLKNENLDILYPRIQFFDEKNNFINESKIENENQVLKGLLHERRTLPATFYKREIINNINFPTEVMIGEDTVYNAMVQSFAEKVSSIALPYYRYLVRHNSLSKKAFTEKAYEGFLFAIQKLINFRNNNFAQNDKEAQLYFEKVITIFLTRITEFHILPSFDKRKYLETKTLLQENNYWHLAKIIAEKYPYFDTSFSKFSKHQKKLIFKAKVYQLIQKLKP